MVLCIWKRYFDNPSSRHKNYVNLCKQAFDIEKEKIIQCGFSPISSHFN